MDQYRQGELERRVRRDSEDTGALVELARLAGRSGVVPPLFQESEVRAAMGRAWLAEPRVRALWEFVLPVVGLEVLRSKASEPGSWWRANGRLGEEPEFYYDLLSDMPLSFRRTSDGAILDLVPAFEGNPEPFLMDRFPVTQRRWQRLTGQRHSSAPREGFLALLMGSADVDEVPVHGFTRTGHREFLSRVDGSLPTQAQWKAAAAGTDGRRYPWGSSPPTPRHANLGGKTGEPGPVTATPEGTGPFGHRDLLGNVRELTRDSWDSDEPMSNKAWATICGVGFLDETGSIESSGSWRFTRDAPPKDMGIRLIEELAGVPERLRWRG